VRSRIRRLPRSLPHVAIGLLLWALAGNQPLAAAPQPPIAEPLRPWVPWVLAEHPDLACPLVAGHRLCAWPGRLTLDLDERGGTFVLGVWADRELDLPLPGDAAHWPREVTDNGATALMRRRAGGPAVHLEPGRHRLAGRFRWSRPPESLPVPPEIALVDLRLRGDAVRFPRRESDGLLWLAAARTREDEQDRLTLELRRRIDDGVPVALTTRLELRIAGRAREVDLGTPLPAGFALVALSGELPLRWAEGERLVIQARPGSWEITLQARSHGPVTALAAGERPAPWPAEEIWVFQSDPRVRAVQLSGAPGIDPQRTSLPEEWKSLPAFRLTPGMTLTFTELRRGEPIPPPDDLHVGRTWWLAQGGDRFTVRDQLHGTLNQGGRLQALAPAELGRVTLASGGEQSPQVITLDPGAEADAAERGVEVRTSELRMTAELTYPRAGRLPAAGWNRDVRSLEVELRLPPGWTLMATTGVDRAAGTWIDRWTLLDLFLLLILSLATWKLDDRRWGLLVLVVLGLSWHEPHATGLWCWWLVLLPVRALLRFWPTGRAAGLLRGLRWLVIVAFSVQLVVFCATQWRTGLFPQLEARRDYPGDFIGGQLAQVPAAAAPEEEFLDEAKAPEEPEKAAVTERAKRRRYAEVVMQAYETRARQVDADAVVQTGPGVPEWSWQSFRLTWNGAVGKDHRLRLLLISPAVELLLSLLRIAGIVVLGWSLIDPRRTPGATAPAAESAAAAAVLLALLAVPALPVLAEEPVSPTPPGPEVPTGDLLRELERRLTAPPECHPDCVEVPWLRLEAGPAALGLIAEVHAAAPAAWPLPGPAESWLPAAVTVDDQPATALRLGADGFVLLRLEPGVHRVELRGPAGDSLVLGFPLRPRTMSWTGDGWTLDGFRPDEPPPSSVRLDRQLPLASTPDEEAAAALAPWLELRRELDVGIPWLVHNELWRRGRADEAVRVRVPLLAGEVVTSAGIPVEEGQAVVTLEAGETARPWHSTLEETAELTLTAPTGQLWLERWELSCSPVWHCDAEGLAPILRMQEQDWRPLWRPWPGEELTLRFTRPAAAPGRTTTIDSAALGVEPGRRLVTSHLELALRSSRGGEQEITLAPETTLESFRIDGEDQPVQFEDGRLRFILEPGAHQLSAAWRQEHGAFVFERVPEIGLGEEEAVNVTVNVQVPNNRWLLWAGGPGWGPVVQFWQYLLVLALAAWALGRYTPTPLRVTDWLLLGAGLTQVPLPAAVFVVLWLLGFAYRHHLRPRRWWSYDLWQLVLFGIGVIGLVILYVAIHTGLLFQPDMQVLGPGSYGSTLQWYVDRAGGTLPRPWVLWLPLWVWRILMLAWSLWLAARLLRWLPWCWQRLTLGPLLAGRSSFRRWIGERQPVPPTGAQASEAATTTQKKEGDNA